MKTDNRITGPWVVPWQFVKEARGLNLPISRWGYGMILGSCGLFGISLGVLLGNIGLGAGMVLFFAYAIPGEWLEWMRKRQIRKARTLWMEAIRVLRTSYLVCGAWRQALVISLPHLPDEIQPYFGQVLAREQTGVPLNQAIKQHLTLLPEMTLFYEVAQILERVGGSYGEALLEDVMEGLEEAVRRSDELAQEAAARQTETRHLFVMFVVELLILRIMGSIYFSGLFHSLYGQWLVSACFMMNVGCFVWVKQRLKRYT